MKPEAQLQRDVRHTLVLLGYTVMETGKSRSRVACSRCGNRAYATGWQGNTPGLPDLYVHRDGWGPLAVALELKAEKGKPSEAQKELAERGVTVIVRSIKQALETLSEVESRIGDASQSARIAGVMEQL